MTFSDLILTVLGNLQRMRWRTALTASGVIIGTSALVLLVSLGVGLQQMMTDQVSKQFGGATIITVMPKFESNGPMGPGAGGATDQKKQAKLDEEAIKRFEALPGVEAIVRTLQLSISRTRHRRLEGSVSSFIAIDKKDLTTLGYKVADGRAAINGKNILVGAQVPKSFYDSKKNATIKRLSLTGKQLDIFIQKNSTQMGGFPAPTTEKAQEYKWRAKVAGVLKSVGPESDGNIYISNRQAKKLSRYLPRGARGQYFTIGVKVSSAEKVASIQSSIREMGFEAMSLADILTGINSVFIIIQAVLGGVASIALLVSAFGIANTMTMAIYERTREIGIMKAIGAGGGDIMRIFVVEAATIGFMGGLGGIILGYLGGKIINMGIFMAYAEQMKDIKGDIIATPWWLILFTMIFATVIGLISGIFPASRASRLSPLGALRHE